MYSNGSQDRLSDQIAFLQNGLCSTASVYVGMARVSNQINGLMLYSSLTKPQKINLVTNNLDYLTGGWRSSPLGCRRSARRHLFLVVSSNGDFIIVVDRTIVTSKLGWRENRKLNRASWKKGISD